VPWLRRSFGRLVSGVEGSEGSWYWVGHSRGRRPDGRGRGPGLCVVLSATAIGYTDVGKHLTYSCSCCSSLSRRGHGGRLWEHCRLLGSSCSFPIHNGRRPTLQPTWMLRLTCSTSSRAIGEEADVFVAGAFSGGGGFAEDSEVWFSPWWRPDGSHESAC
jgi:hypothetical protein